MPNIHQTPGGLMRGVRRKASRIATRMTRVLCVVGDLPTTLFPAAGENLLDPLTAIVREFQSNESEAFATAQRGHAVTCGGSDRDEYF